MAQASADPIHAIANGDYWHHDSGWIFPEKIGPFTRVGIPQDVAGSRDAVAHYARMAGTTRTTAVVDVYPTDTAATGATLPASKAATLRGMSPSARLSSESAVAVGIAQSLSGTRVVYAEDGALVGLYFVSAGEWIVRIRVTAPHVDNDTARIIEDFALGQRWDTLSAR
jgi:hypothetical protein